MHTYIDCIPCFYKQIIDTCRMLNVEDKISKKIIDKFSLEIPTIKLNLTPPEIAIKVHDIIKEETNIQDPYKNIKEKSNKEALKVYPKLLDIVSKSENKLLTSVKLAIAGNIIDYGAQSNVNLENEIADILSKEEQILEHENSELFDYSNFEIKIKQAKTILYLGDNAGEIVFDKLLIEHIKNMDNSKKIYFAVREKPIINDVLIEDAKLCKIDEFAQILSSGSNAPGTILKLCNKEFLDLFNSVDLIISKGQGNYEALSIENNNREIFFLFIAKCPIVANYNNCNIRDIILKCSNM